MLDILERPEIHQEHAKRSVPFLSSPELTMISFTATLPQSSWPSHMGNLRVGTTILMSSLSSAVSIVSALPSVPAYGRSTFIHGCGTTFPLTHPFHTSYLSRYVPGYLKELQDGHAEGSHCSRCIWRMSGSRSCVSLRFLFPPVRILTSQIAYRRAAMRPRTRFQSTYSHNKRPLASRTMKRLTLPDPCLVRAATPLRARSAWGFWRPHVIQRRREGFKRSLMWSLGGSVVSHVDTRETTRVDIYCSLSSPDVRR